MTKQYKLTIQLNDIPNKVKEKDLPEYFEEHIKEFGIIKEQIEQIEQIQSICSICMEPYFGIGNNAEPINKGRCCDFCNDDVILARLKEMGINLSKLPTTRDKEGGE